MNTGPLEDEERRQRKRRGLAGQKHAADPAHSAWVGANAGAGKTRVLTDRVMRLMLSGTPPERILCLTFTNAAAAEMATRLHQRLGAWVAMDDAALAAELEDLTGNQPRAEDIERARQLFARALETPGGLKIQTLHGFCQGLLARFPLEARIGPHFRLLGEDDAMVLLQEARQTVLRRHHALGLEADVALLAQRLSDQKIEALLQDLIARRAAIAAAIRRHGDVDAVIGAVCERLGVTAEQAEAVESQAYEPLEPASLRRAAEAMIAHGTPTDQKAGQKIAAFLAGEEGFDNYAKAFMTGKGEIRKRLATKRVVDAMPEILSVLGAEAERILQRQALLRACLTARLTAAGLRLGTAILDGYAALKEQQGRLDYEDLILRSRDLLLTSDIAPWILFKLDGGIDHILLDEAQDTSPAQWEVVAALAEEFFSGEGADRARTIFAVGDEKQSIYSFQGAAPERFAEMRQHFLERAHAARRAFEPVELHLSFRSAPEVLQAVDSVFAQEELRKAVTMGGEKVRHDAFRDRLPGLVEVHPPIRPPEEEEKNPWDAPVDAPAPGDPQVLLARRVADDIAARLAAGEGVAVIGSEGDLTWRPLCPGDIMVLVRRRGSFYRELILALKDKGLPVAGTDRLRLTDEIAVMDLLSLARFVLMPDDDLSLAEALKSPLIGMGEEELFAIAHDRKDSLFAALRAAAVRDGGRMAEIHAYLEELRARADHQPPFEFFAQILGADGGRRKALSRLGGEAADAMEEILALCLAYEQEHVPSLQGFVEWVAAGEHVINRDMEQGRDEIRILTAHGAKGLEAPVVYLPDTCALPSTQKDPVLYFDRDGLPFLYAGSGLDSDVAASLREAHDAAALEEYYRLLYVAMTRAEQRLYVFGALSRRQKEPQKDCWYAVLQAGIGAHDGVQAIPDKPAGEEHILRIGTLPPRLREDMPQEAPPSPPLPAWCRTKARQEEILTPVNPSRLGAVPPAPGRRADEENRIRFRRGNLTHKLLQILPGTLAEQRVRVAGDWLRRQAGDLPQDVRDDILREVLAILEDERLSPIFGPGSIAEVPVTGVIAGRTVSGQIDRLLVRDRDVLIVDYKSNRPAPRDAAAVPEPYLRQMALYRQVLRDIYPQHGIRCALLWTEDARIMFLDAAVLDGILASLALT